MFNGYKFNQAKYNGVGVSPINASVTINCLQALFVICNVSFRSTGPRRNRFRVHKHNDPIEVTNHRL